MTNEAAERLRGWVSEQDSEWHTQLDQALAAAKAEGAREAVATVKGILDDHGWLGHVPKEHAGWRTGESWVLHVARHFDEEAAR